jgi:hypothetical protein
MAGRDRAAMPCAFARRAAHGRIRTGVRGGARLARTSSMTSTKLRTDPTIFRRQRVEPFFDDDVVDDDEGPVETRAVDPLAAEPLTTEEIRNLQRVDPDIEEDRELTVHAMASTTEAQMPIEDDDDELLAPSNDQLLEVRRRPKAKDHP